MRAIDADKLPVQKIYHVDEAGYGATFYMVDVEDIKAAPTITYEDLVPHGRWEQVEDFDGEHHWRCSACGIEWWFEVGGPVENGTHYCPNCGAKMDATDTNVGDKDGGKDNERT